MTARNDVLEYGLIDWVSLDRIHWYVRNENVGQSNAATQSQVIGLLTALVTEGLFVLGDTTGAGGRFVAWELSLPDALSRVRDLYIDNFDDANTWGWAVWLDLTEKGRPEAEELNAEWLASQKDS
ncbi:hypothetical protein FHT40_006141 [Mycolicibacterium sp. BK556]|uniref:hypothetical protein n=1 Tax=unclassified Mycolicibacterium TaxID=2636767 RepID=UPI00104816AB|nr:MULTISPECIES: hypothetical protein [unclassified Mycolicibacterium]MBB3606450.1 hypothetical protein [Mycolicibacterium sp. BK556]MBB3636304.1 hypothetical protein [Mycolicibacterium sp. BK607]MBB3753597.1 hypothetical protein [Mycolicibacterium sp. BK634]